MTRPAVLVRLLPLAVAVALTCATAAVALPPVCETDCPDPGGGPVVTTVTPGLWVANLSGGLTQDEPMAARINCGSDCSEGGGTFSYSQSCDDGTCTSTGVDTVTLVASSGPSGFSPSWTLCRANSSTGACQDSARFACDATPGGKCEIQMTDDTRVEMTWIDVTDPNTGFSSPPAVVGPAVKTFHAAASDNAGVARVQFAIDGVFAGQDTTPGDGFAWTVNPNTYSDGSVHTLTAQAFDTSGRSDTTPASTNFTVDRSTQVAITAPAAGAHSQSAPQFSFTIEAGASAVCKTMSGASGDTSLHQAACTSSYTPQATSPGEYRVRIEATDAVGNTATVDRSFVIDAPSAQPTQTTQPGTGEQGGGTSQVSSAAILAGLGKDLEAAARGLARQRQSRLVRARGRSISVNALTAGTFALVFKGAAGRARASRTVTIGRGRVVAAGAGRYALRLKLTKAGARLLRRGRRVSGRLTMSFTTPSGSKLTASRKVTMKRR